MPPSQAVASSSSQKGTYDLQTQLMTENVTGSLQISEGKGKVIKYK